MDADGDALRLDVITTVDIVGCTAIEHDWVDLSERHGVAVIPNDVPNTEEELLASRFLVTSFVFRHGLGVYTSDSEMFSE